MEKLDLTKKYKNYYKAKAKPELVDIEPAQFLSIVGKGDPSGDAFSQRIQALYVTAYAIKFLFKAQDMDFTVSKLEALWWFDMEKFSGLSLEQVPGKVARSEWEYRLLLRMPEYVTQNEVEIGISTAVNKKKVELANQIEFYKMNEGKSVQMLHLGPFSTEIETLKQMKTFMDSCGFQQNGAHHEIYLSDFRKVDASKLRTILREPIK